MQPNQSKTPTGLKALFWLFIGLGTILICNGTNLAFQSIRCIDLPTTEGTIRSSHVGWQRSNRGGTTHSAEVSYDYSVAGSRYTGTKVAIGAMSASSARAHSVVDHYPTGAKVPVHYSPNDPAASVLETGIHGGTGICFGVGSIFALVGIMFLQLMKWQPDSNQTAPANERTDDTRIRAPQILMAVIIFLFGASPIIMAQTDPNHAIIMYSFGGVFCVVGLYVLTYRPGEIRLQRFFSIAISVLMLGVFNWIVFGSGDVDLFSGVIVGVLDFMFLAVAVRWLVNRLKKNPRGRRPQN